MGAGKRNAEPSSWKRAEMFRLHPYGDLCVVGHALPWEGERIPEKGYYGIEIPVTPPVFLCKRRKHRKEGASEGRIYRAGDHVPQYVPFIPGSCSEYVKEGRADGRTDGSGDVHAVP